MAGTSGSNWSGCLKGQRPLQRRPRERAFPSKQDLPSRRAFSDGRQEDRADTQEIDLPRGGKQGRQGVTGCQHRPPPRLPCPTYLSHSGARFFLSVTPVPPATPGIGEPISEG